DVVSRGLMGLTVGCARCHDHKFDPISMADYYSLYGVFASTTEPEDLPIIGSPKQATAFQEFQKQLQLREQALAELEQQSLVALQDEIRQRAGDCLQQVARQIDEWKSTPVSFDEKKEPRRPIVQRWQRYMERTSDNLNPILIPWQTLSKSTATNFGRDVETLITSWQNSAEASATAVNSKLRTLIVDHRPINLIELGRLYGSLFDDVRMEWETAKSSNPEITALANSESEQIRQVLYGSDSPASVNLDEGRKIFGRDIKNKVTALQREVDDLKFTSPGTPPRAMILRDGALQTPRIFLRGNPDRPGDEVPRQFLEIVSATERKPFSVGSGRLEMANAILNEANPLTARVYVNRIWQHHFGTGIVPTPSDFGTRGIAPSHPD
ncbi:MAG: DUF1553 domain-containing protein, partial [Planctomycetes bacterium]|nr:DUF1553 domain-containing protein [Planctomycetota bacterium]